MDHWLIGDIGGTNSRLASWSAVTGITGQATYRNADAPAFDALVATHLATLGKEAPKRAAFAVAGPVQADTVVLTNRGWRISATDLQATFGFREARLINDFTSVAWALTALKSGDRVPVGPGQACEGSAMAVLGPGTGLGVSGLLPSGRSWTALVGEGGHVTLPANDEFEEFVLQRLRVVHDHVSAERVLSGPGLPVLYAALAERAGTRCDEVTPEYVTAHCETDPLAAEAVQRFCLWLGTVASDLALTLGATGGVYIAGGLLPRLQAELLQSGFRSRFEAKGRFRSYLSSIPTYLIVHPQPGLLGVGAYLANLEHATTRD